MLNYFRRLFSYSHLEDALRHERSENSRLKLEHAHEIERFVDKTDDLKEVHAREILNLRQTLDKVEAFFFTKEKLYERQIDTLNKEREHMQDEFLRMCGVNPMRSTPAEAVQHFEDQPDDSGPVGAQIMEREQQAYDEWYSQKLGMTSERLNGQPQAAKIGDNYK